MKEIALTQGQIAIVDDEDFQGLSEFKWCAMLDPCTGGFYAGRNTRRTSGKRTTEKMHRHILGLQHGDKRQGDHINHKGLDNRRENLRVVTHRRNGENRLHKSKYGVGISFEAHLKSRPFKLSAIIDGKRRRLGRFNTAEEAVAYRDMVLREREHTINRRKNERN